jgi:hypothetical protein
MPDKLTEPFPGVITAGTPTCLGDTEVLEGLGGAGGNPELSVLATCKGLSEGLASLSAIADKVRLLKGKGFNLFL